MFSRSQDENNKKSDTAQPQEHEHHMVLEIITKARMNWWQSVQRSEVENFTVGKHIFR
jgi:hypothetical protein